MRTGFRRGLWLLLFVPLVSNAVPLASPDEDRRAKQAVPPQGKALIYIYRTDGGAKVSPTLRLNNRELGALQPRTYFMVPVDPGRVDVRADDETLSIRAQDGRIYFVHLAVTGSGGGQFTQVSYGRGRQEVHAARLARTGQPADSIARAAPRQEDGVTSSGRSGFNLIVKGGTFSLASDSQTVVAVPLTIEATSPGLGLEGEWITSSGWAFGAEFLSHNHAFTTTSGSGDMATTVVMLNVKKYFRYGATVQPYLGVGVGSTVAELSSTGAVSVNGSAGGFAAQAMGGVAFRWSHFGIYTELKYQNATTEDASGNGVDVSGMGMFIGMSAQF